MAERKRFRRCPEPKFSVPPPGAVGLDRRADCPRCGKRVHVTVRGLYWTHNGLVRRG